MKVNGVSLNIDLLNACCLACHSCAVGSIGRRKGERMSLDLFKRILDRLEAQSRIRHVQLYVYSDPCLVADLDQYVAECTRRGLKTWISTMLQTTKCDFAKVIEARPTEFRISFPGFTHMGYYQRGAHPEIFKRKFLEVVNLPRYPETTWSLCYHVYKDNQDNDLAVARSMAKIHGLKFIPLPAIMMVNERVVDKNYTEQDRGLISHLIETPEQAISRMKLSTDFCSLWKQVTIDATGMVMLCQILYEDRFKLMPFLDYDLKTIQRTIREHPFCDKCMKAGGDVYQNCYADFTKYDDPVGEANRRRLK